METVVRDVTVEMFVKVVKLDDLEKHSLERLAVETVVRDMIVVLVENSVKAEKLDYL